MPRRPRVHLDNVPLHIVQRGHNREPCFFGEEDYGSYLQWLKEALADPLPSIVNVMIGTRADRKPQKYGWLTR